MLNLQVYSDLRYIASTSDSSYHHANSVTQLADVLIGTVDRLSVIELLGKFKFHSLGKVKSTKPKKPT